MSRTLHFGKNATSAQNTLKRRARMLAQAVSSCGPKHVENLEARQLLSLVMQWHMDEGAFASTLADSSGNFRDGTVPITALNIYTGEPGKIGNAVKFDSTGAPTVDAISTTSYISEVLENTGSLAVWVKTTAVGNDSFWLTGAITGLEQSGAGNDIAWGWLDAAGRICLAVSNDGAVKSLSPINDGEWHHVAMTRNAATGDVKLYVDGYLNASARFSPGTMNGVPGPTGFSTVGALTQTNGSFTYFEGSLDELNVYDHVLTDAEVAGLYDPTHQPPSAATGLSVAGAGTTAIKLTWTNTATNASSYIIERSPDGSTWAPVAQIAISQSYVDRGLTPSTTYYYRVKAANYFGTAAPTNTVTATTIPVAAAGNGTGLLGLYYDNGGQTNPTVNQSLLYTGLVITRIDPVVNFSWGTGAPDYRMGVDQFSVKWVGEVQAQYTEFYTFYTQTDDGAFLYIDLNDGMGLQKIIDDPTYHGAAGNEKSSEALKPGGVQLVAGQKYKIMMGMFEDGGDAAAQLRWESLSTPKDIIPKSQLFPGTFTSAPSPASGLSAAPASGYAGANNIILNWTEGTDAIGYRLLRAESGAGPWLEVGRVGGATYTDQVYPGKTYYYKLIAFNTAGESSESNVATATSTSLPTGSTGLLGFYWDNRTLSGTPAAIRVDVQRLDSANGGAPVPNTGVIDWPDIDGSPNLATGVGTIDDGNNFSVRWQGSFTPPTTGNYTFWTRTDDDVRFYIAGNRQIAAPNAGNFNAGRGAPGAPGDSSGAIYLQAGTAYPIIMEYNQGTGGARAELRWQGPNIAQALMPATPVSPAIVPTVTPTNLAAIAGSGAVTLTWIDPSMSEQGFYVEMSTDGGATWSRYATVGQFWNANPTSGTPLPTANGSYTVGGLQPNTAYSFRLKAFNLAGESAPSDVVSVTTSQLSTDAVMAYPFSESSGTTTKDSTGTFTANLTGAVRFTSRGRQGNAILFDESGHVDAGNLAQFNPATQLSIAAWINAYDWNGNRRIVQKGNADNQYRLLAENVTVNNVTTRMLRFHIANVGSIVAPLPSAGEWHHVAATYDGASMKLYVDGVLAASDNASGTLPVTGDNLFIGTKGGTTVRNDRFMGKMDDVRIYDTALTEAAITALAAETPVVAPTNLQATVPAGEAGHFQVDLKWTDNSTQNFPSFKILRGVGNFWTELPVVVDGTSFSDLTVVPGTTYSYKVVAFNTLGSAESNVASATPTAVEEVGALTGTSSALSGSINLTTVGASGDWAHFGVTTGDTAASVAPGGSVITQTQNGTYVAWEAEDAFWATDPDMDGRTGRVLDSTTTPPANGTSTTTTASGGKALLLDEGPSPKRGQAFVNWNIQITEPGYYRLYARRRIQDVDGDGSLGNNDSVLVPRIMSVPMGGTGQFDNEWQFGGDANFSWTNSGYDYYVAVPGLYTFPIGPREGGAVLDRLVLSKSVALSAAELDAMANSSIASQISYEVIGDAAPSAINGPATFTWSDGSVTAAGNTTEGLSVTGENNGFRISAPASSTFNRKLRVYVGAGANSKGELVARLSDGSAPAYTATIDNSAGGSVLGRVYEFDFKSGMSNQSLSVRLSSTTGSVAIFGAALIENAIPAAATGLKAIPVSRSDTSLTWNDNSSNETSFRIERSTDGATWSPLGTVGANTTTYTDVGAPTGASYRVIAANGAGSAAPSNTVAGVFLKDPVGPWQTKDIGAVGIAGDGAIDPATGMARLISSGADIWTGGDQFRFLYQQVTGDFTISAHVLPFDRWNDANADVDPWIKAGVMVRELVDDQIDGRTASQSPMVDMVVTGENNIREQWRQTQDGSGRSYDVNKYFSREGWVRLQRLGGTILTFWSADGVNWIPGNQPAMNSSILAAQNNAQMSLPETVYVGLAVTSHDNANITSVLFSDVKLEVTPPAAPNAPTGLKAVPITGDRVALSWTDNSDNETQFVIERNDGSGWTELGRTDLNVTGYVDSGLTDGQAYSYRVKAARFTNLSAATTEVAATATAGEALPAGWTAANLVNTNPNVYGYNTALDTFDMTVQGGDHWTNDDDMGYVYQAASGDFSITTRVNQQQRQGNWSKTGIAIRETANADAAAVSLVVTPANGIQFMWRDTTNTNTAGIYTYEVDRRYSGLTGDFSAPIWLRLTRVGNDFIAYYSYDGANWTQYGRHTTVMAADVTAGMTHTSNNLSGTTYGPASVATFTGTTIGAPQVIDGTSNTIALTDFSSAGDLTLNGWSYIADNKLVLVPPGQNARGSAFFTTPRDVQKFNVAFDFQVPNSSTADGFAFVIQGQSPRFLSTAGGGALGYTNYAWVNQNAMAIKFDVYPSVDQTGLYVNNVGGGVPDDGLDLRLSNIDIDSGRRYHVTISVDGSTVTQTITDVLLPQYTFSTTYTVMLNGNPVDLPTLLGSQYGYIGFTAANGGLATQPEILNFSYEAQAVTPPSINIVGTGAAETWYVKRDGADVKVWNNADGSGAPAQTVAFATMTDFNINGGGEADTLVLDLTGGAIFPASGLNVAGGKVKLQLVGGDSVTLPAVQLGAGASLDLGTNDLVIQNATYADIAALVASARAGSPRWTGPGIGTSDANADQGLVLDQVGADVKIKFTWNGDLNMDGRVNADDYFYIDQGFLQKPQPPKYHDGDFNFDGKINADDYFLIDQAFLNQGGVVLSAPKPALAEAVTATKKTAARQSLFSSLKVRKGRRVAAKLHRR